MADRIAGGLLGLAAGDALGSTLEFLTRETVMARYRGDHREMTGGGAFAWRPGQGTDDSDLAWAVTEVYLGGYAVERAAEAMLAWFEAGPADVGVTTAAALGEYRRSRDPLSSGRVAAGRLERCAGNGSLMRALPTALVRADPAERARDAGELSAITHADRRCVEACIAYCDLAAALVEGAAPHEALDHVVAASPLSADVREVVARAPHRARSALGTGGFVLDTLSVGVWALFQPGTLEDVLVEVVNLGGDADTTGAVAGGLLGVHHGAGAVPARWRAVLEYGDAIEVAAPRLVELREASAGQTRGSAVAGTTPACAARRRSPPTTTPARPSPGVTEGGPCHDHHHH